MHHLFFWIPNSLNNSLKKFENFLSTRSISWELSHPVRRISIKVHYWNRFEFGEPELILVISPSSKLRITLHFFFFGFLILQGTFFKIFKIFLNRLNWLASDSIGSSSQLVWSTDFGGFGAQVILSSSPYSRSVLGIVWVQLWALFWVS